ncbi:hypothetical protein CsSME_00051428 [Camellia sinensis var. sinensis]
MATAKLSFTKLVVLALAAAVLVEFSAAANHTVGDTTGWVNNPSGGATFYSNWASKQTFATGDILVFNYVTGQHNVARVSKNAYDTCDSTSPMSTETNGPANINLNTTGEYYFFCTVGTHCNQGQKLAINVTSSTTAPSPGTPSSPPTPPSSVSPPPPPPSSAPPKAVAAFAVVLMSIAIGVMC